MAFSVNSIIGFNDVFKFFSNTGIEHNWLLPWRLCYWSEWEEVRLARWNLSFLLLNYDMLACISRKKMRNDASEIRTHQVTGELVLPGVGEKYYAAALFLRRNLWVTNDDSETDILAVVSSNFSSHSRFVNLFWARLIIFLFLLAMLCYCLLLSLCLTDGFYSVQSRVVITKRKMLRNIEILECVQRIRKWMQYLLVSFFRE